MSMRFLVHALFNNWVSLLAALVFLALCVSGCGDEDLDVIIPHHLSDDAWPIFTYQKPSKDPLACFISEHGTLLLDYGDSYDTFRQYENGPERIATSGLWFLTKTKMDRQSLHDEFKFSDLLSCPLVVHHQ